MISLKVMGDQSRLSEFCDEVELTDQYLVVGYNKPENVRDVSFLTLEPQTKLAAYMDAAYILRQIATKFGYDLL